MLRMAFPLTALVISVGCTATQAERTGGGPVRLGQTAYYDGPRVRPDRVIEDSRCPVNVRCVWAGRVVLRATVFGGGWTKQVDLTLGDPLAIADGALTLTSVSPEKTTDKHLKMHDYRFAFAFQGGI